MHICFIFSFCVTEMGNLWSDTRRPFNHWWVQYFCVTISVVLNIVVARVFKNVCIWHRRMRVVRMCASHLYALAYVCKTWPRAHVKMKCQEKKMVHFMFITMDCVILCCSCVFVWNSVFIYNPYITVCLYVLVCYSYILVCYSYALVCYSYALVCTRMLLLCSCMYSYGRRSGLVVSKLDSPPRCINGCRRT